MSESERQAVCRSRAHCVVCRLDAAWRQRVGTPDQCPMPVGEAVAAQARQIREAFAGGCCG
jgi:hypothetical protein